MKTQTCKTSHMRINSLRKITNCILFLILISIPFNVKAQSTQMSVKSTSVDNRVPPTNNISKENLIGFGADLFFPKDALAVTSEIKYFTSIVNNEDSCPNKDKIEDICDSIFDHTEDNDPDSPYAYLYQQIIEEASCVKKGDSKAEKIKKINEMWNRLEDELICNSTRFNVKNGNILKLAVARRFDSVIYDVAQVWKINLNRVDPSDKRTVLDYVRDKIEIYKNTGNEKVLEDYYKILRAGDAKHASEL